MEFVSTHLDNKILEVKLNRPDKRNAFHPKMISELTETFKDAHRNNDVNIIVLSGNGKSFCAGADLNWMKSMVDYSLEENQKDSIDLFEMFEAALFCKKPIIGKVHGHVMGGALGLTAICDFTAAVEGTKFCFSEAKLGLVPAVISPFVMNKMNASYANRLMITAELFDSNEALQAGLVDFVGDDSAVDSRIAGLLDHLKSLGPVAVSETKKLIQFNKHNSWSDIKKKTTEVIAERRVSDEGQSRLKKFLEK